MLNEIVFMDAGNSVVVAGVKEGTLNDGCMCGYDSWPWWGTTARFLYDCSQQAFCDSLLSVSAVHTALWDKCRYGSLRGSCRGRYRRRIGTPSPPRGHKVREGVEQKKKKRNRVCACVFMPEWMRLWLWHSAVGSNALFPSPEGWASEDKCVFMYVCSCSKAKALYPDRCLCLPCLTVMSSSCWVFVWPFLGLASASKREETERALRRQTCLWSRRATHDRREQLVRNHCLMWWQRAHLSSAGPFWGTMLQCGPCPEEYHCTR